MAWTDKHIPWLKKTDDVVTTADGKPVVVWELQHTDDAEILSAWAKHFRNHYCLDTDIDRLRRGSEHKTRKDFLNNIKLPEAAPGFGPSVRSGDFAEILVADFLQYLLGYWVPRTRYGRKMTRNESSKGCDTVGFKYVKDGSVSPNDMLALFECKADLSGKKPSERLQEAVTDSIKDEIRKGEALNSIKQLFLDRNLEDDANKVERFQNMEDKPYREHFGAVALMTHTAFCPKAIGLTSAKEHPHRSQLDIIVIRGKDLMPLVHELYRRAADEA